MITSNVRYCGKNEILLKVALSHKYSLAIYSVWMRYFLFSSKVKEALAAADDILTVFQMTAFVSGMIENILGKGEKKTIHFCLFPQ